MTPLFLKTEFSSLAEKTKTLLKNSMQEDSPKNQAALSLLNELEAVIASVQQKDVNEPVVCFSSIKVMKRPDGTQLDENGLDLRPDVVAKTVTVEHTTSHDKLDIGLLNKMEALIRKDFTSGTITTGSDELCCAIDQCDYCSSESENNRCAITLNWRVIKTTTH